MKMYQGAYLDALNFAKLAHADQVRKYTGEPYWYHLASVANIVIETGEWTSNQIQAALLHDVVEDTPVTLLEVEEHFGPDVAWYVDLLSDPPHWFGNRAARKQYVVDVMRDAPDEVKTIKLADIIDNASSIIKYDPHFAVRFVEEKTVLLESLKGGNKFLWGKAADILV